MSVLSKLKLLLIIGAILMMTTDGAFSWAQAMEEKQLTQADIDGYVYMVPRLQGEVLQDPVALTTLFREAKLSRARLVFITSKIAIAQAMVSGLLSPDQISKAQVAKAMHPSTEELALVQKNINSIYRAQNFVKAASAPPLSY